MLRKPGVYTLQIRRVRSRFFEHHSGPCSTVVSTILDGPEEIGEEFGDNLFTTAQHRELLDICFGVSKAEEICRASVRTGVDPDIFIGCHYQAEVDLVEDVRSGHSQYYRLVVDRRVFRKILPPRTIKRGVMISTLQKRAEAVAIHTVRLFYFPGGGWSCETESLKRSEEVIGYDWEIVLDESIALHCIALHEDKSK